MDTSGPKLNLLKAAGSILNITPQCEEKPFNVGFRDKMPVLCSRTGSLPNTLSEQSEGFTCLCPSVRTIILSSEQMNYSQALAQY